MMLALPDIKCHKVFMPSFCELKQVFTRSIFVTLTTA